MRNKEDGLIGNLSWKFAERVSAQLVTFVVSIVLARMLEPSHYGIISIVTIFISLANVFVSDGFPSALVQKKDADALDYSSVLYFNIAFSIVLYLVLYFCAPLISKFYGEGYEILTPVLRVLGLRIILSAVNSVQQAYIAKQMIFRKFFFATLTGTIISAVVGIAMAYLGFGVWALVAQYMTNTTIDTFFLCISLKKKPILKFSLKRLKQLLGFGIRILGTSLLITGYQELRALIIGKIYSSDDLAFYDKGRQFPQLIVTNINTSIGMVLFPKMANEQDNQEALKSTMRNSIRFSSYLMCPMMLGLAAVAKPTVSLILTDKWLPCVPILQLFCIIYLFQPIHTANMQAIKAVGRGDTYLKLEIIKKTIELITLLAVMWISVNAIVISMAVLTTAFTFVNAYPNIKYLNYSFKEQMHDIMPPLGMSIIMATIVFLMSYLAIPTLPLLIIQCISGMALYFAMSIFSKNKELKYILNTLNNILHNKNHKQETTDNQ